MSEIVSPHIFTHLLTFCICERPLGERDRQVTCRDKSGVFVCVTLVMTMTMNDNEKLYLSSEVKNQKYKIPIHVYIV